MYLKERNQQIKEIMLQEDVFNDHSIRINEGLQSFDFLAKTIFGLHTDMIRESTELLISFSEIHKNELQKLPYHLNLLDQIRTNENAHTRIFAELLKQNDNGTYEVLISFYKYLAKRESFFRPSKNINPRITVEKGRIDLLICDDEFAIIIENKIHGAVDQNSQIANYIKRVRSMGYATSSIYIVYLTKDKTKEVDDKSWFSEENDKLKEEYSDRFFHFTYMFDVLPWLQEQVYPNVKLKDVFLRSAIEQYIDHLEGMFNLRTIQKQMKTKIQNHLKEVLGFNSSNTFETNREIIKNKLEDLELIKTHLSSMQIDETLKVFSQWSDQLKKDFVNPELYFNLKETEVFKNLAVKLSYKNHYFSVLIEFCEDDDKIYMGIGRHYASEEKSNVILDGLIPEFKKNTYIVDDDNWWYMWRYTDFPNGYKDLKQLIIEVKNFLEKINS